MNLSPSPLSQQVRQAGILNGYQSRRKKNQNSKVYLTLVKHIARENINNIDSMIPTMLDNNKLVTRVAVVG